MKKIANLFQIFIGYISILALTFLHKLEEQIVSFHVSDIDCILFELSFQLFFLLLSLISPFLRKEFPLISFPSSFNVRVPKPHEKRSFKSFRKQNRATSCAKHEATRDSQGEYRRVGISVQQISRRSWPR